MKPLAGWRGKRIVKGDWIYVRMDRGICHVSFLSRGFWVSVSMPFYDFQGTASSLSLGVCLEVSIIDGFLFFFFGIME